MGVTPDSPARAGGGCTSHDSNYSNYFKQKVWAPSSHCWKLRQNSRRAGDIFCLVSLKLPLSAAAPGVAGQQRSQPSWYHCAPMQKEHPCMDRESTWCCSTAPLKTVTVRDCPWESRRRAGRGFFHGEGTHHWEGGKGRKGTEVKGQAGWQMPGSRLGGTWHSYLWTTQCCQMGRKPCFAHFYANVHHN